MTAVGVVLVQPVVAIYASDGKRCRLERVIVCLTFTTRPGPVCVIEGMTILFSYVVTLEDKPIICQSLCGFAINDAGLR